MDYGLILSYWFVDELINGVVTDVMYGVGTNTPHLCGPFSLSDGHDVHDFQILFRKWTHLTKGQSSAFLAVDYR